MMTSKMADKLGRVNVLKSLSTPKPKTRGNMLRRPNPTPLAVLQRSFGNRHIQALSERKISPPLIQRKCACDGTAAKEEQAIQAKLKVGAANDRYEQEADQVATQVMRMPDISRQSDEEEEEVIQPKIQRVSKNGDAGFDPGPDFKLSRNGGKSLSAATRQFMEPRFGADFSTVRLHTDAEAERSAAQINARAYTHGNHITLGKGATESDRSLMAHELTHVVQQTMGSNTEGVLQREEHEGGEGGVTGEFTRERGFTFNPEEGITNRFGFNLNLEIPLRTDLTLGPVAFFNQLEISAEGSTESANLSLGATRIETLAPEVALMLISLEMEKLKRTRFGDFSLEAGMGLSANASAELSPEGLETGAGLGLSANVEAGFQSRPFRLLGENLRFTAGLEGEASAGFNLGERPGLELEGGASVGLVAPDRRGEPFVRAVLRGSVEMRGTGGGLEVESRGVNFAGFVVGFRFGRE